MKDLTGTRVGQYEIVERLGGGGMAVVYRAVQQPLGREVALKALSPELFQDDGFVKRFETEAKTLAKLDHPNILPIYDFEVTAGGKQLQVAPNHLVTIVLTATASGGAQRQVEHFDGTRWTPAAKTVQSGCGTTYQANSTTLGIFALVAQGAATTPNGPGGGG